MNVAIYHPFTDLPDNYSLSHVVMEQMRMLTEHGVSTHFVTSKGFRGDVPKAVNVYAVLPYKGVEEIKSAANAVIGNGIDAVLTHDIVYLDSYKDHAEALRQIPANYVHWSHSAPRGTKKNPLPGLYVSMNYTDLPMLAKMYGVPEGQCRVVYNPVSPDVFFDWHPFTKHLVDTHGLLDCDVLITYPLDTGRFQAKGGFKIIKLVEHLRKEGQNAKVVFVNAAANTKERTTFVKALRNDYTIFTSLEATDWIPTVYKAQARKHEKWHKEHPEAPKYCSDTTITTTPPMVDARDNYVVVVPRRVVRELFQISNLFTLLSESEGCSLVLIEAALCKNLVIINEDFPPMIEFATIDEALRMKVSSTRLTTDYAIAGNPAPPRGSKEAKRAEDNYYTDWARIVIDHLQRDKANQFNRKVLKQFNREWIWEHQLAPLLQPAASIRQ